MDINELFTLKSSKTVSTNQQKKKVSVVNYLNAKPLVYGLEENLINHNFILQKDVPSICAQNLKDGKTELAVIPSVEYAHGKGDWKIVPDICIASYTAVKSAGLFFNKGVKDIKTIAVDSGSTTSVALLKILMNEKYESSPQYIFMEPNLDEMLKKADAALIIGDKALHYQAGFSSHLDLGDEWFDLTGLPFVYFFWAGNKSSLTSDDVKIIKESHKTGHENLKNIAASYAVNQKFDQRFYYDYLTKNMSYSFGVEEKEGLLEFYKYAFFLGLIEHIPELHFFED